MDNFWQTAKILIRNVFVEQTDLVQTYVVCASIFVRVFSRISMDTNLLYRITFTFQNKCKSIHVSV